MSGPRGGTGAAGAKKATLFAAGFLMFGLFLGGAPHVVGSAQSNGTQQGLLLAPGADSEASCAEYPCATVAVSSSSRARISFSLGVDSDNELQPETYYTDLLMITNPTGAAVSVTSVLISGLAATSQRDFGSITLYYCPAQTNTPQVGCEGSFTARDQAGGSAFQGTDLLAPGAARYLELSGFAGEGSHVGDTLSFNIEVTAG